MLAGMNTTDKQQSLRNATRDELPGLLSELEASGLGIAAFARERGLKPQNLYVAKRRLKNGRKQVVVFDPVKVIDPIGSNASFRLGIPSGHKLVVSDNFCSSSLRRILEVLEAC